MNPPRPLERIAHRGAKRECTENTLPAFARAVERGADGVELDVHATADGVVVVHHDPDLAIAGGHRQAIADLTWQELRQAAIAVPRLSDVLDAVSERATLYVELKGWGVEGPVADLIRTPRRCAVHSFDHSAVARKIGRAHV